MESSEKYSPLGENISIALPTKTYVDLEEAINQLDRDAQKIVLMYYVDGYGIKEIAQKEGVTTAAMKQKLYRARKRIKEFLFDI